MSGVAVITDAVLRVGSIPPPRVVHSRLAAFSVCYALEVIVA